MRLIDADALIDKMDIMISDAILADTAIPYALIRELVAEQPTIEAEPVRHWRWIQKILPIGGGDKIRMYLCSECDKYVSMDSDYCPNCGAKMDKEG